MLKRDDILLTQEQIWGKYRVFGKSFKYNQLVQNGNFESTANWIAQSCSITVNNNEATITCFENATVSIRQSQNIIKDHKYLLMAKIISLNSTNDIKIEDTQDYWISGAQTVISSPEINKEYQISFIKSATITGATDIRVMRIDNSVVGDSWKYKKCIFIDLTDRFGAGNEPTTLAEFYATDLGKEIQKGFYPPYSATNTIYTATSPLSFSSKNLFNKKGNITLGYRLSTTRTDFNSENSYISEFIPISPNTIYTKNSPIGDAYHRFAFYSSNNVSSFISVAETNTVTTPSNAHFLRFCGYQNELTNAQLEEGNTVTSYTPYINITFAPSPAITLSGYDTAKDYWQNWNGKVSRVIENVDLGSLDWFKQSDGLFRVGAGVINNIKAPSSNLDIANIKCSKYNADTFVNVANKTTDKTMAVQASGAFEIYDTEYTDAIAFKTAMSGIILHYELATPTTEQANSVMLPKGITKCTDANGVELEIELLNDPNNFSNKIVSGKASPTITGEKIITKGFTSGGEHFTQLYIYDDGEIWYVNGGSSAQAFAFDTWEIEYKQIQFDSGVELTTAERTALLNAYDLI